jgi:hypothetical protein
LTTTLFATLFVLAGEGGACPLCHTETGEQVRAVIFGKSFLMNLLLSFAPFPLFMLVVAFVYYRFPIAPEKEPQ